MTTQCVLEAHESAIAKFEKKKTTNASLQVYWCVYIRAFALYLAGIYSMLQKVNVTVTRYPFLFIKITHKQLMFKIDICLYLTT